MTNSNGSSAVSIDPQLPMAIAGMYVMRSICNPIRESQRLEEAHFRIGAGYAESVESGILPTLMGQVVTNTTSGSHMLAITAMAVCIPGSDMQIDPLDYEQANAFLKKWGNWGAHPIWDFCGSQLRTMASGLQQPDLILTSLTPEPEFDFQEPSANDKTESD